MSPSAANLAMAGAEASGDVLVDLLTFTHEELDQPVRLCNRKCELLSTDGPVSLWGLRSTAAGRVGPDAADPEHVFSWIGFEAVRPGYREGATPQIRIAMDLLDRAAMLPLVRTRRLGRVNCLYESVLEDSPNVVVDRFTGFILRKAPWTHTSLQLTLELTRYDVEPYPVGEMTPTAFPGLFA